MNPPTLMTIFIEKFQIFLFSNIVHKMFDFFFKAFLGFRDNNLYLQRNRYASLDCQPNQT